MKKYLTIAAGLMASAALMMAAGPAMAATHVDVGINIGIPCTFPAPVYVQPQPVYVQPQLAYVQPQPVYIERGRGQDRHDRHWGHDRGEHRGH
jgi:PXPV repeat-containing protein